MCSGSLLDLGGQQANENMSNIPTKFYVQQEKQGNGKNWIIYNLTKDNACAEWNEQTTGWSIVPVKSA